MRNDSHDGLGPSISPPSHIESLSNKQVQASIPGFRSEAFDNDMETAYGNGNIEGPYRDASYKVPLERGQTGFTRHYIPGD